MYIIIKHDSNQFNNCIIKSSKVNKYFYILFDLVLSEIFFYIFYTYRINKLRFKFEFLFKSCLSLYYNYTSNSRN